MVWSIRMAAQYRLPLRRERRNDRRAHARGRRAHPLRARLEGAARRLRRARRARGAGGGRGGGGARGVLEPLRGEPAVDQQALVAILVGLGRLVVERDDVRSVDVNPLIVCDGRPIAVDVLVVLGPPRPERAARPAADVLARFRPLFHPCGVIVAGASSHPGKLGFRAFHHLPPLGFPGAVYPVNRDGGEILGRACLRSVAEVPAGKADLAFACPPPAPNVGTPRACAERGGGAAV